MENSKATPITIDPTGGEILSVVGGNYRILVSGKQTNGAFSTVEMLVPPQNGPGPHSHATFYESFYIVEGEVEVYSEAGTYVAKKGSFVVVPEGGIIHYFKNVSDKMAQLLCTVVPAGLEEFFEEIGEPVAAGEFLPLPPMDAESIKNIQAIAQKHGQVLYPQTSLIRNPQSNLNLHGMSDKKVILITGASSGIGMASAIYFAKQGWNVAATMRNRKSLNEYKDHPNIKSFELDVTSVDSIKNAMEDILKTFIKIDVLFNNAGYALAGPFEAIADEDIRKQFETNLFGVMNVTRAILPHFRARKSGMILNTTSSGGNFTFPLYSVYNSTKWALEGFMEALQYELAPFNIVIKNLAPGAVKSEFTKSTSFISNPDYDDYANRVQGNMVASYQKAPGADTVAKVAFKAATDENHRLRYAATMQARMGFFLRWLLPLHMFNKMISAPLEMKIDKYTAQV